MTTMGVTVFCNRVQINGNPQELLGFPKMLLRTLQDNESNILVNQPHLIVPNSISASTGTHIRNEKSVLPPHDPSRLKKHGKNGQPLPVAVARRNARERNRVKQVNNGYAVLRQHIPSHIAASYGDKGKKLSKVETLRMAVEYIRELQRLLAEADGREYDPNAGLSHNVSSPTSSIVSSSHNDAVKRLTLEDDTNGEKDKSEGFHDDDEDVAVGKSRIIFTRRLSPNPMSTITSSSRDNYARTMDDEKNFKPRARQARSGKTSQTFSRLSPNSIPSPPSEYYTQNEENLEPHILPPYSGAGDSEEDRTTYAASSDAGFSGVLYYKPDITDSGEFMDVVTCWEQEQGRLTHRTQQNSQRLAHV